MAAARIAAAKQEKALKAIASLPANRRCFVTGHLGAQYVDTTHNVLVSTDAAGVMREFGWRTKSLSMAKFSAEEVKALKAGGNEKGAQRWLATWEQNRFPRPPPGNLRRIREWVSAVLKDGRFEDTSGGAAGAGAGVASAGGFGAFGAPPASGAGRSAAPTPAPAGPRQVQDVSQQQRQQQASDPFASGASGGWADFGSDVPRQAPAPSASTASIAGSLASQDLAGFGGGPSAAEWSAFGDAPAPAAPAARAAPAAPAKPGASAGAWDAFGNSAPAAASGGFGTFGDAPAAPASAAPAAPGEWNPFGDAPGAQPARAQEASAGPSEKDPFKADDDAFGGFGGAVDAPPSGDACSAFDATIAGASGASSSQGSLAATSQAKVDPFAHAEPAPQEESKPVAAPASRAMLSEDLFSAPASAVVPDVSSTGGASQAMPTNPFGGSEAAGRATGPQGVGVPTPQQQQQGFPGQMQPQQQQQHGFPGQMPLPQQPQGFPGQMPAQQQPQGFPGQMPPQQKPQGYPGQMPYQQQPQGYPGQMLPQQQPQGYPGQMPYQQQPQGYSGQMPYQQQQPQGFPGQMPYQQLQPQGFPGQMPQQQQQGLVANGLAGVGQQPQQQPTPSQAEPEDPPAPDFFADLNPSGLSRTAGVAFIKDSAPAAPAAPLPTPAPAMAAASPLDSFGVGLGGALPPAVPPARTNGGAPPAKASTNPFA